MASQISIPEFSELIRVFTRIGCVSFGGPAGQIALMHRELVDERKWIDEEQYLHALNFCHLLPGPEAQQLATWIGWRMHGVRGGLATLDGGGCRRDCQFDPLVRAACAVCRHFRTAIWSGPALLAEHGQFQRDRRPALSARGYVDIPTEVERHHDPGRHQPCRTCFGVGGCLAAPSLTSPASVWRHFPHFR